MIVYPENWEQNIFTKSFARNLLQILYKIIKEINITHLSLSGGIDSTLMLALLTKQLKQTINTYTISCRKDHPDIVFARLAARVFGAKHTEIIVEPAALREGEEVGDNAVRQFYKIVSEHTDSIIACDGIDELACGYYDHLTSSNRKETYLKYLDDLKDLHLVPLDKNSGDVRVFLPFLDKVVIEYLQGISLEDKLEGNTRKAIIVEAAKLLNVPNEIIQRNKYGFCDAFNEVDK